MIARRKFVETLGGVAAAALLHPTWAAPRARTAASREAADLYRKAFVLDCNTLASIGLATEDDVQIVQAICESGVTAVKSTLGGAGRTFDQAVADIAAAEHLIEKRADLFLKIRTHSDLDLARQHKLGIIYSFEAASPLEDKIERIEMFRKLGVLVMQLTYNRRSPFGMGCLDGDTGGLTELGRQAITKVKGARGTAVPRPFKIQNTLGVLA